MNPAVSISNLTKRYSIGLFKKNGVLALDGCSLEVNAGEIFGLLGPNGAGKTTLVKILLGIVFPTGGEAAVLGHPLSDYHIRAKLGYLPENHRFPGYLTGWQVLTYYGALSGVPKDALKQRADELLALVKMSEWKNMKVKRYSKGMLQRVGLAQALVNDPDLIFLDEPTDGVDPLGRKEIRDILLGLKQKGKTIFLNSHLLSEVELICDRVAILNKGKVIRAGTVAELTRPRNLFRIELATLPDGLLADLRTKAKEVAVEGNLLRVEPLNSDINPIIDFLRARGVQILSFAPEKETLESSFIEILQKPQV